MDPALLHEGLRFLQSNRTFLGREFLTWLWYVTETNNHEVDVPGHGKFQLYVDDKLVLTATSGAAHENILKGGTPAYAAEAKQALLSGKLVAEAKFILQADDKQWMWSMKAEDLSLRGLRIPSVTEPDAASHMSRRLAHIQTLSDVIDHLFKAYMGIRITPQFEDEVKRMSSWMASKVGTNDH
jgi:hypothetical protein